MAEIAGTRALRHVTPELSSQPFKNQAREPKIRVRKRDTRTDKPENAETISENL